MKTLIQAEPSDETKSKLAFVLSAAKNKNAIILHKALLGWDSDCSYWFVRLLLENITGNRVIFTDSRYDITKNSSFIILENVIEGKITSLSLFSSLVRSFGD